MSKRTCRIEGCEKPTKSARATMCSMHVSRVERHGDPHYVTPARKVDPSVRFWSKVEKRSEGECWPYGGTILPNGYGQFSMGKDVRWLAHRFAYTDAVGPIPEGMTLDHVKARGCTRTDCVNPAHLEPVTMRENLARSNAVSSVNRAKTHCPKGHEYDYVRKYGNGKTIRKCRLCYNEWQRVTRAAKKAAA